MKQLVILILVFAEGFFISAGARAQTEEKKQDLCSITCEAEYKECTNKTGPLHSRTPAQIDIAEKCYDECSKKGGDDLEACEEQKYDCWKEILGRKNPNGTWQCMYAGGIDYIKPDCKTEGEVGCDAPREACMEELTKTQKSCWDRCGALESEQAAEASLESCREQKAACLIKNEVCWVNTLVDKIPTESDLKISENAKRMNEELKSLFGDWPLVDETKVRSKVPEITGDTPYLFDNPLSTKDNRYFSFTADVKNHIIEYRGGNKVALEFPDGTTFVPESGDFIRVPVGTKIKTEMGLYQGNSQYDNIGKFGMSSLGITNVAGGSSIVLGGGSVVELVPMVNGESSNVKLNDGNIRIGTGGFDGTERPGLPAEIQFDGRQDVEISWDGTDFAVGYNRESGEIITEIYDGTIKVAADGKIYPLSSKYGSEIKRIEINGSGEVAEKIAVSGIISQKRLEEEPKKIVNAKAGLNGRRSWSWLLSVMGVVGLVAVSGFGYRKKFGTWPLETRWKPVAVKLMKVYDVITNKLK